MASKIFPACACIERVNGQLVKRGATRVSQGMAAYDVSPQQLGMEMTGAAVFTTLDDGTKKRGEKALSLFASFCPFCGVEYAESPGQQPAPAFPPLSAGTFDLTEGWTMILDDSDGVFSAEIREKNGEADGSLHVEGCHDDSLADAAIALLHRLDATDARLTASVAAAFGRFTEQAMREILARIVAPTTPTEKEAPYA